MKSMKSMKQAGFTLIELVMVIVILGILAAVAIPKFVDLKGDAQTAALAGVVGAMDSASAINYATKSANSAKGVTTASSTCDVAIAAILQGGVPSGYTVANTATGVAGTVNTCAVTQTGGGTSNATIISI